jgi:uncharacterized membrane protein YfcA
MTPLQSILLIAGATLAAALNSFAGGGGIIILPLLMFLGLSPTAANMTGTVAIVPGLLMSSWAYRGVLERSHQHVKNASIIGLIGGLVGAVILMASPAALFGKLVPYLMLFATAAFLYGSWFLKVEVGSNGSSEDLGWKQGLGLALLSLYGGYWGGGIGLMTLGVMSLGGWTDINEMNATKTLFAASTNVAGVILFSLYGEVHWMAVLFLTMGTMMGGYLGATFVQRLKPDLVRGAVAVYAIGMTLYFFVTAKN